MIISVSGRAGSGKDTVGRILQWIFFKKLAAEYPAAWKPTLKEWLKAYKKDCIHNDTVYTGWEIRKWATVLRQVATLLLGMDEAFLYTEEFKAMVLPESWVTYHVYWKFSETPDRIFSTLDEVDAYLKSVGAFVYYEKDSPNDVIIPKRMTGREFLQRLGTDAIRNNLHPNTWVNALMSRYTENENWIITDTRFPNELEAVKAKGGITILVNRSSLIQSAAELHPSETALDNATFDYTIDNIGSIDQLAEQVEAIIQSITLKSNENANNDSASAAKTQIQSNHKS